MANSNENFANALATFFRRDDKGNRIYTDREVQDFIALLMINNQLEGIKVPESLDNVVASFAVRVGFAGPNVQKGKSLQELIEAYFKKFPLNQKLVQEFKDLT